MPKLNYGYLEGITKVVVVPFIMHIISIKNIKIVLDNALLIHYNKRVRRLADGKTKAEHTEVGRLHIS